MISTLLIFERTLVKVYFMEELPYKLFNWRNSLMMFVFVITAIIGYLVIFSSKRNCKTDCSIIYSDFGWPILIMFGILWCLVVASSIFLCVNMRKHFKEFANTGLQKYHGKIERSQTSMMKPCKEREAIIKSTIRMISYTFHYIVPCKLNY